VEYTIPTAGAEPSGLVTGPDGRLWFTEHAAGKVGAVTPQGVFQEYPVGLNVGLERIAVSGKLRSVAYTQILKGTVGVIYLDSFGSSGGRTCASAGWRSV